MSLRAHLGTHPWVAFSLLLRLAWASHGATHCKGGYQEGQDKVDDGQLHVQESQNHCDAASTPSAASSFSSRLAKHSISERLARVLPLAYVHLPKCGTGFMDSLVRLPGACSEFPQADQSWSDLQGGCPGISRGAGHAGLGSEYQSLAGHAVIMFRQPEQRLISGYHNEDDSGPQPHGWCNLFGLRKPEPWLYAHVAQGVAVKTLTRDGGKEFDNGKGFHCDYRKPMENETHLAVHRLREGFVFVGVMEEWRLSVCLLHTMFGGECHAQEMRNTHPGPKHSDAPYSVTLLQGFRDGHDGAVYEEAVRIFHRNLQIYNVSAESCKPCFRQAGLF